MNSDTVMLQVRMSDPLQVGFAMAINEADPSDLMRGIHAGGFEVIDGVEAPAYRLTTLSDVRYGVFGSTHVSLYEQVVQVCPEMPQIESTAEMETVARACADEQIKAPVIGVLQSKISRQKAHVFCELEPQLQASKALNSMLNDAFGDVDVDALAPMAGTASSSGQTMAWAMLVKGQILSASFQKGSAVLRGIACGNVLAEARGLAAA
jgi:hypothetical protein